MAKKSTGNRLLKTSIFSRRNKRRGMLKARVLMGAYRLWPHLRQSWRLWPLAIVLAIATLVIHEFHINDRYRLAMIELPVCRHLTQADLQAFLHMRIGQNIFSIDLDGAAKRIRRHPWVKTATVRRELPDRIAVELTEREAVAWLRLDKIYLVDSEGNPFKAMEDGDSGILPFLTGFDREAFESGDERVARHEAELIRGAVRMLNSLTAQGLIAAEDISEVNYDSVNGFAFIVNNDVGTRVRLGAGEFELKMNRYNQMKQLYPTQMQQVTLVDLAIPDRVLVRGFRKGTGA